MATTIEFNYEGQDFCLEFTRKTITQLERQGFSIGEIEDHPMTVLPNLFAGAFLAHHKFVKREKIDAIYEKMTNRQELLETLGTMYREPIEALVEEPEESSGNIAWAAKE